MSVLFVLVNMVAQLAGCFMVILRKYVTVAVGLLFGVIILQVCANVSFTLCKGIPYSGLFWQ